MKIVKNKIELEKEKQQAFQFKVQYFGLKVRVLEVAHKTEELKHQTGVCPIDTKNILKTYNELIDAIIPKPKDKKDGPPMVVLQTFTKYPNLDAMEAEHE